MRLGKLGRHGIDLNLDIIDEWIRDRRGIGQWHSARLRRAE
jgi:hypothetical protein